VVYEVMKVEVPSVGLENVTVNVEFSCRMETEEGAPGVAKKGTRFVVRVEIGEETSEVALLLSDVSTAK
jgi:hypothetical protein